MLNTEEERKCWFLPLVSEGSSPFWFGTPEQENTSSKWGLWTSGSTPGSSSERRFIGPIPLLLDPNLLGGPRNASWQDAQVICIFKWIHWSGCRTGASQRALQARRIGFTWELGGNADILSAPDLQNQKLGEWGSTIYF